MQSLRGFNKKFILFFVVFFAFFLGVIFGINYLLQNKSTTFSDSSKNLDVQSEQIEPSQDEIENVDINAVSPSANLCLLEFEIKEVPSAIDASIDKQFRNLNNENLPSSYVIKNSEKIVVFTRVINTGNVALSDLVVKDPLSSEFNSTGAKNLDQFSFREFLNNPNGVCNYDESFNFINCSLPKLEPKEIFEFSFIVNAKSDLLSGVDIVNVTRLTSTKNSIIKYANDVLKTPIKTESTHLICKDKACVLVSGSGKNLCSEDSECVYSVCESNSCVEETCEDGDCDNECDNDSDCKEETHLECVNDTCKRVDGEGKNTCVDNTDCYSTHLECRNSSCVAVQGKGQNSCSTDNDCRLSPTVYSVPSTGVPFSTTLLLVIYLPALLFAISLLLRGITSKK